MIFKQFEGQCAAIDKQYETSLTAVQNSKVQHFKVIFGPVPAGPTVRSVPNRSDVPGLSASRRAARRAQDRR